MCDFDAVNTAFQTRAATVSIATTGSTTLGVGSGAFAAASPPACRNVQITINGGSGTATLYPLFTATVNASGFDVRGDASQSLTFYWQAIGH